MPLSSEDDDGETAMNVLIADDDWRTLSLLERHLRSWGHCVTTARDGTDCLRALRRDAGIQAAILNWLMPEFDGWKVCCVLKAGRWRNIHTTLMVGRRFCEEIRRAPWAPADDYLCKPLDLQCVRARLDLALPRLRSEAVRRPDLRPCRGRGDSASKLVVTDFSNRD